MGQTMFERCVAALQDNAWDGSEPRNAHDDTKVIVGIVLGALAEPTAEMTLRGGSVDSRVSSSEAADIWRTMVEAMGVPS